MANALQKLKKLVNPEKAQVSGTILSKVSDGVFRVRPLGQDTGVVVCRGAADLKAGDRVYYRGNDILGKSPTTGSLTFVEV